MRDISHVTCRLPSPIQSMIRCSGWRRTIADSRFGDSLYSAQFIRFHSDGSTAMLDHILHTVVQVTSVSGGRQVASSACPDGGIVGACVTAAGRMGYSGFFIGLRRGGRNSSSMIAFRIVTIRRTRSTVIHINGTAFFTLPSLHRHTGHGQLLLTLHHFAAILYYARCVVIRRRVAMVVVLLLLVMIQRMLPPLPPTITALPDTAKSYSMSSWKRGALGAARRALPAVGQVVVDDAVRLLRSALGTVRVRDLVAHRALHQRGRALLLLCLQLGLSWCRDRCLPPTVEIAVDALCRNREHRLQALAHHARLLRPPRSAKLHHIETETTLPAIGPLAGFTVFASCPAPTRSIATTTTTIPLVTVHSGTTTTTITTATRVLFIRMQHRHTGHRQLRYILTVPLDQRPYVLDQRDRILDQLRYVFLLRRQIVQIHHNVLQPEQLVVRQVDVRLTDELVLPARLTLQVRVAEQRVHVLRQHVPEHLGEERVAKLLRHLRVVLDLRDLQLLHDAERVQEVAAEHERIRRRVHRVYPAGRDEERVAGGQVHPRTLLDRVAKEHVRLLAGQHPLLVQLQVLLRRRYQPEHLAAAQDVIPDGRAAEVDVKFFTDIRQYFCTFGYIMSFSRLVDSTCDSFSCFGHTTSTQSIWRTIAGLCT
uniref:Uncharacterized protein n=1 Tax=Anopheles farauti TaxID=69004 RepID=A0A182PZT9_9DIPT